LRLEPGVSIIGELSIGSGRLGGGLGGTDYAGRAVIRLIRFAAFFVVVVGLLVYLVLPAALSPLLTQYVRDMGVQADDLTVTVDAFDPALFSGRAVRLRVQGTNVEIGRTRVGEMDVTFGNVSIFDRSFQTLSGQLEDVVVAGGGATAEAVQVNVLGSADNASATGQLDDAQSEAMVKLAAKRAGVSLDSARLVDGGIQLTLGGLEIDAGIGVEGGALVLRPGIGEPILLLQPNTSDPWRLSEAYVTPSGITVRGTVDASRIADQIEQPSN
jgi:hypothetical protein